MHIHTMLTIYKVTKSVSQSKQLDFMQFTKQNPVWTLNIDLDGIAHLNEAQRETEKKEWIRVEWHAKKDSTKQRHTET